jgi:hypothetical protein
LCVLFVFLVHSAEYESWSLPMAIILIAPVCLPFALLGIWGRGIDNNLITQIGFVVLIGLAAKNAVLIVEFAKQLEEGGRTSIEAAVEASHLRLRPILMTSFAFILGVLPMVIAQGAGAEMRWSLGTAVFSGMLGVTLFGIFLTPVFFYVIEGLGETRTFRLPEVQWIGSALIGGLAGDAIGFMTWKAGFPYPWWAMGGGFVLGIITAIFVQGGRRKWKRIPHAGEMKSR